MNMKTCDPVCDSHPMCDCPERYKEMLKPIDQSGHCLDCGSQKCLCNSKKVDDFTEARIKKSVQENGLIDGREPASTGNSELLAGATDMDTGVWFKSAVSGMLYRNYKAAGDIECIRVDGVWYDISKAT